MKKIFLLLSGIVFVVICTKGQEITVHEKTMENGDIVLTADNTFPCPITLVLTCKLENIKPDIKLPLEKVLNPSEKGQLLLKLRPEPGKAYGYGYEYLYFYGNVRDTSYDKNYVYQLPFEQGETYLVTQGYNGSFSHQGKNCLDFQMPLKSKIYAAREGVVVMVKEDSDKGCPEKSCVEDGNYIVIYHEDGTFAEYYHLVHDGSLVKTGQAVKKGQVIGLCGNTGWSEYPHLHFGVYLPGKENLVFVPTKFKTLQGQAIFLEEGEKYTYTD